MVLYINFQPLANKRKEQSDSKRRHWLAPPQQNYWLRYRWTKTGPFIPPCLND